VTIADRLRLGFAVGLAVALLVGLTGLAALTLVARQVSALVDQAQPLATAHGRMLRGLTEAETAERGLLIAGQAASRGRYEAAVESFRSGAADALELADGEFIEGLLETEIAAGERWIQTFASPVLALQLEDPEAALARARTGEGRALFDVYRDVHAETGAALAAQVDRAQDLADNASRITRVALALLLLGGGGLTAAVAYRTTAAIITPLSNLAGSVDRLRDDRAVRAGVEGPAEVRAVALAINRLAEENQRFAEERAEVVERLEELDRQKSEFVSIVSHELRTPLTSIIGYLEMLQDGDAGELTDDQLALLVVGQRNAGRLLALIEDMLTLSRIESGTMRRVVAPVDVRGIVEDVTDELRPRLAGRDLRLTVDVEPAVVDGDRDQLERVLFNLVGNALKFTPDGGEVAVTAQRRDDEVVLAVRDSGIGIPPDELDRLFERFYRASTATERSIPGTGLGLAITGLLVEQHGGHIEVASEPGGGTTFTVHLPTAPEEALA
jgi:two-component system, OmpR family, sensor kinase